MALKFGTTTLSGTNKIFYNNQAVTKIYYNGSLVWSSTLSSCSLCGGSGTYSGTCTFCGVNGKCAACAGLG